jgi:8-oxo-dGTP pyrophosphatase MutT (NUDIX family)
MNKEYVYNGFCKIYKDGIFEVVEASNSVGFLIYLKDTDEVVLIRQKRSAMKSAENPDGYNMEAPAGRFDNGLGVKELIAQEAGEEVGAKIELDKVILLNQGKPLALSPGLITEKMYLGYVEITSDLLEEDRVFGVDEGEEIQRIKVKVEDLKNMIQDDMKTFALIQWFLSEKENHPFL